MYRNRPTVAGVFFAVLLSCSAYGSPISGTVIGTWSNPALTGNLLLSNGQPQFFDNTTTAIYSITNSADGLSGSALTYGYNVASPQPFSVLTFFGSTLTNVPGDTPVRLGTMTFLNGTSDLNTLIFGAQLTLSVKNNPSVDPLVATGTILTTQNTGFDPNFDADVFYFDVLFPSTFNVFEGNSATADIYGKFVGDPQIQLTSVQVAPGETGGFIGQGIPSPVPEPESVIMAIAGLAAMAIFSRTRRG